jgi:bacteriocin-like protein
MIGHCHKPHELTTDELDQVSGGSGGFEIMSFTFGIGVPATIGSGSGDAEGNVNFNDLSITSTTGCVGRFKSIR